MASFSASIPTQRETLETNGAGDQNHNEDNKTKIKQGWQQKLSGKGNTNAPRCAKCEKIVYKMEEIVALGSTWHKSCFSCGATSDPMDGCNRILSLATYMDNKKKPYCKACFDRNFTPKGTGFGNSLVPPDSGKTDFSAVQLRNHVEASAQKSGSESSELDFDGSPPSIESPSANSEMSFKERWQTNANAAAERRKSEQATLREIQTGIGKLSGENTVQKRLKSLGAVSAPKCPVCSKSVYKMEEIVALGNTWHKSCFCCGAGTTPSDLGCGRTLTLATYETQKERPFCKACFAKNFAPKGFNTALSVNTVVSEVVWGEVSVSPESVNSARSEL